MTIGSGGVLDWPGGSTNMESSLDCAIRSMSDPDFDRDADRDGPCDGGLPVLLGLETTMPFFFERRRTRDSYSARPSAGVKCLLK